MAEKPKTPKGYLQVEIAHIIPDSLVDFDIHVFRHNRLILYKPAHEIIQEEHIERLLSMGSEFFFIQTEQRSALLNYYEEHLDTLMKSPLIQGPNKGDVLQKVSSHVMERTFKKPELAENDRKWQLLVRNQFNYMLQNQDCFDSLIAIAEKDSYTYTHSVNVGLMIMGFAIDNGVKSEQEIMNIGYGGLLHDLGKALIPETIIKKPTSLNIHEWLLIQKHPQKGMELLNLHNKNAPQEKLIIGQHHESFHGTGYPEKLKGRQIDYWARACRIIDAFDAMTSNRPYRFALTPYETLKQMINMRENFDQHIFRDFISFLQIDRIKHLKDRYTPVARPA